MSAEERKRLADSLRVAGGALNEAIGDLEKGTAVVGPEATAGQVKTVAVIGAGIMGRGIAHAAALGGYRTILEDLLPTALRRAESEIRANLDKAVELGKVLRRTPMQHFGGLNMRARWKRRRAKLT